MGCEAEFPQHAPGQAANVQVLGQRIVPYSYNRGTPLPWWLKMAGRLLSPRLGVVGRIGHIFHTPKTDDTDLGRLIDLFETKFNLYRTKSKRPPESYLELGPGDTVARALVAAAHGVERIWLVDVGNFARRDMRHYHAIAAGLTERGLAVPDLSNCTRLDDILRACRASYLTGGLSSLREIEDSSVDLIISEAVLEHLPREDFQGFLHEFARLLTPTGLALHGVDLDDHIDGGLNHLRFSTNFWERSWIKKSSFYTNRFSHSQISKMADLEDLEVDEYYRLCWPGPRLGLDQLHLDMTGWRSQDLEIRSFGLVLNHPAKDNQDDQPRRVARRL